MYPHCPKCNSAATVEISYGYPSDDILERSRHGLVALGGCDIPTDGDGFSHHCLTCEHQWDSTVQRNAFSLDVLSMLETLEETNTFIAKKIESLFWEEGRGDTERSPSVLVHCFAELHQAWATFSSLLHDFGETVLVYDDGGKVINEFSTVDAFDVVQKQLGTLYYHLGTLANASFRLGQASKAGGADEISSASALVQEARARLNERREEARVLVMGATNL